MRKVIYEITVEHGILKQKNKLPVVYENKNWVVAKLYGGDEKPYIFSRENLCSMADFYSSFGNKNYFHDYYYAGDKNSIDFFSGLKVKNVFFRLKQLEARESNLASQLWNSKNNINRYKKMIEDNTQYIDRLNKELEDVRKDIETIKTNGSVPEVEQVKQK